MWAEEDKKSRPQDTAAISKNQWTDEMMIKLKKLWTLDWTSTKNKLSALTGNNASQSQN